ncbi:G protein-coupled receptor [Komagataella phaffii CBS 7435]|uniref:Plasma membrane G protein coupled receptor (GPCR) that interacts with the heterotrimeric G protein a n=2 Tax=Komagataella phaffii TaxID=460519 RepID=C4QZK5_KOMPG|nr:Plasma membrane G protein coupled receptor (GPCR) that interacts with the heterotrimeric G protein a [Komagataella phaffii GS115]AOA62398.1 GQ67_00101T0 [Komagataella phaffii]CAH2448826.1 G protein-coupled receptor [Komagataella phaffii CBS 7435]AOA67933.1 GQ68_01286T0 [Komagataella phaffii GS115]CAY68679.1 Plasma membrane G protein coupled receptor (GPCR) that interacts with the heterotrimeric G protein a [Komagataella phaffii GS115]CCA38907.1 G protein-coupled receptor [Komagataella phaff
MSTETARITDFSDESARIIRILAISSSSTSIAFGLVSFYLFGAIDYSKRVFRHQLIIFLILFDFLKAIFLLIFPARTLDNPESADNRTFCNAIGFFTAVSIEGADIAILAFAVHTALLIFRPNKKVRNGNNLEGGLFRYRYPVYLVSFLTPILLASLAFINGSGYVPISSWSYLPVHPIWYRLVLSWVPRYIILISIITIYCSIYFYILSQYNSVGGTAKIMWKESLWYKLSNIVLMLFFPDISLSSRSHGQNAEAAPDSKNIDNVSVDDNTEFGNWNRLFSIKEEDNSMSSNIQRPFEKVKIPSSSSMSPRNTAAYEEKEKDQIIHDLRERIQLETQETINKETVELFQIRRLQILKQMKVIFIYPIAYIFLWLFPFILQCVEFNYSREGGPVLWLNYVAAFMQPFNCTVDSLVFFFRETPWNLTSSSVDHLYEHKYSDFRRSVSFLPMYGLPDQYLRGTPPVAPSNADQNNSISPFTNYLMNKPRSLRPSVSSNIDPSQTEEIAGADDDMSFTEALQFLRGEPPAEKPVPNSADLSASPKARKLSKVSWRSSRRGSATDSHYSAKRNRSDPSSDEQPSSNLNSSNKSPDDPSDSPPFSLPHTGALEPQLTHIPETSASSPKHSPKQSRQSSASNRKDVPFLGFFKSSKSEPQSSEASQVDNHSHQSHSQSHNGSEEDLTFLEFLSQGPKN